jgi:tryptophan-rich sensory protein
MAAENSIPKLVGSVLLCEAVGGVGSVFAYDGVRNWYPNLEKPSFNPPSWMFGPVWTLLYAMMGVSLYVALRQRGEDDSAVRISHTLFGI